MFFWWSVHFIIILCHSISIMHCCCFVQWLCCVWLCNPIDCSTPDFPVLCLSEFAQTPVHWAGDTIQPSHPLLPPSPPALIFPSIRVFSNESALHIRWPKYWSFSFNISPSNEYSALISFRWLDLLAVQRTLRSLLWHHNKEASISAFLIVSYICTWLLEKP